MRIKIFIKNLCHNKNITREAIRIINKSNISKYSRKLVDLINKYEINKRKIVNENDDKKVQEVSRLLIKNKWAEIPSEWLQDELIELNNQLEIIKKINIEPDINRNKKSKIWEYISDRIQNKEKLNETSPLVKIALNPKLICVISDYLGQIPWLRYTLITSSIYTNGDYDYSQKWHLDFDDERMLKLFIYMTDVEGGEYGPFQFLDFETSSKVENSFFRKHLRDSEICETKINSGKVIMLGKKTKAFLVDTHSLYHCGSRLGEGCSRILYTALFTAYPSIYPGAKNGFDVSVNADERQKKILIPAEE